MKIILIVISIIACSFGYDFRFPNRTIMDIVKFNENDIGKIGLCLNDSSTWELLSILPNKWAIRSIDAVYPCTTKAGSEFIGTSTCLIISDGNLIHFFMPEQYSTNLQGPNNIITVRMGRIIKDLYESSEYWRIPINTAALMSGGKPSQGFSMVTMDGIDFFREYMSYFANTSGFYKNHIILPVTK